MHDIHDDPDPGTVPWPQDIIQKPEKKINPVAVSDPSKIGEESVSPNPQCISASQEVDEEENKLEGIYPEWCQTEKPNFPYPGQQSCVLSDRTIGLLIEIVDPLDRKKRKWVRVSSRSIDGQWPWSIGRFLDEDHTKELPSLTKNHFELTISENGVLLLENMESRNGVYLQLEPFLEHPLAHGSRFRMGRSLVEFQRNDWPVERGYPEGIAGKTLLDRTFPWRASLNLIDCDGNIYVSIPLFDRAETTLGRGGIKGSQSCDVTIPDSQLSSIHARILSRDGEFYLKDLNSLNGTFFECVGPTSVQVGTINPPGHASIFLVGDLKIKFHDL